MMIIMMMIKIRIMITMITIKLNIRKARRLLPEESRRIHTED